ncbi:hypothetical protein [Bradyrhizobium genosp. P]|uniref:hypothetical protein n=1 Tax=Bradyrhizobium genosp. P TaxID=83641 RepID=UPI003CE99690
MSEPVTIARLERALAICAYLVVRDGAVVVPLYERLERDLAKLRQTQDAMGRAKRLLETYGGPRLALAPPLADQDRLAPVFTAPRPNHAGSTVSK